MIVRAAIPMGFDDGRGDKTKGHPQRSGNLAEKATVLCSYGGGLLPPQKHSTVNTIYCQDIIHFIMHFIMHFIIRLPTLYFSKNHTRHYHYSFGNTCTKDDTIHRVSPYTVCI